MISLTMLSYGQIEEKKYEDLCSRSSLHEPDIPVPAINDNLPEVPTSCPIQNAAGFTTLTANELFEYIRDVDDPYTCVNRILYGFHSDHSPVIFENAKVQYVANQTVALATSFDGQNDNGVHGTFTYLSIAGLMATFYSNDIQLTPDTWDAIQDACRALALNKSAKTSVDVSYYTFAHMFFAASFEEIGVDSAIVDLSKDFLNDLAADSYQGLPDIYPYYYCYYYLLDLYFRYPLSQQSFIDQVVLQDDVITALGDAAINTNINSQTYQHFGDISNLCASDLGSFAPFPELQHVVEPALVDVTDTYPTTDSRWVQAALALVQNGMNFTLTEEEILETLHDNLFPNEFSFEDGKIIISTPLPYEEIVPLYQSILEVRAQFFRMLEDDSSVLDDTNDTLNVKLYGTRDDYRNFNNILFGVNYPNSGGVYIETYGTFYTYQRLPGESTYTMEELFRHEYTHYLQGRYIIPGGWGASPMYDNSRLVWFEEGMAQFFSASTRASNVQALEVIRNSIQNSGEIQDLTSVLSSSYSTGNPDAYYIYGAMFWTKLYHKNRHVFLELIDLIKNEQLVDFDNLVEDYKTSGLENTAYVSFIDSLILENDIWMSPNTVGIMPDNVDPYCLDTIVDEMMDIIPSLDVATSEVSVTVKPRRFEVSGAVAINYNGSDKGVMNALFNQQLNNYINILEISAYNNFAHTTAYFDEVRTGSGTGVYAADFHIMGPINDFCNAIDTDDISAEPFEDHVILYPPDDLPFSYRFRYREIGSSNWIELDTTTHSTVQINLLTSIHGYEYQISYECIEDTWSSHSATKTFYLCPEDLNYNEAITDNLTLNAASTLSTSSTVSNSAAVTFSGAISVNLDPTFEVSHGASVEISNDDCSVRQ